MQFQYQYTPTDLAVIRDADDRIYFSPGTTITVWAEAEAAAKTQRGMNNLEVSAVIMGGVPSVGQ